MLLCLNMQIPQTFDVLIIGAGPAGVAAALTLNQCAPDLKICMLESNRMPKRLLESLSPLANSFLHRMGLWDAFLAKKFPPAYGNAAVWGSSINYENEFIFQSQGHGWQIDRASFDEVLKRQCLKKNIPIKTGSHYCSHAWTKKGWEIILAESGIKKSMSAKFVIDASGRRAEFAKREGASKKMTDRLVAIYALLNSQASDRFPHDFTLVEAQDSGWWYSAMMEDKKCLVSWMSDADLIKKNNMRKESKFLNKLSQTWYSQTRVKKCDKISALQLFPAASFLLKKLGGPGWVASGDAACTYDPLSSSGNLKGLRTGTLAAYVALDYFDGKGEEGLTKYTRLIQSEYRGYLQTRKTFYQQENRWASFPFWQRRQ